MFIIYKNVVVYVVTFCICLFCLISCSDNCGLNENSLRGNWVQTQDVLTDGGSAEIYYEFSPPEIFQVTIRQGTAFPTGGFCRLIDSDLCQITWYWDYETKDDPIYRWANIELTDDQMIIDMVDPQVDSVLAENVVLIRVR